MSRPTKKWTIFPEYFANDTKHIMASTVVSFNAKAYSTCIAPQAAYRSCSGTVRATDRAGVQPIGRKLSLRPQTYDQPAIRSPGLPLYGLYPVINVITWITTHLLTPEWWKAELAWLVGP